MQVVFLIDKNNDWIKPYAKNFKKKFKNNKYKIKISDKLFGFSKSIVFLLGNTRIVGNNFLRKNLVTLVIHESNLPKGKGFAPVQWQILNNAKKIPIVLFKASEKVDSGNIIFRDKFFVKKTDLNEDIRKSQANSTFKLIKKYLMKYPSIVEKKQYGKSTYFKKRTKKDSKLNLKKSLLSQLNLLRIVDNKKYPAYFNYLGKKFTIKIYK